MKGSIMENLKGMIQYYFKHAVGKSKHRKMRRFSIRITTNDDDGILFY